MINIHILSTFSKAVKTYTKKYSKIKSDLKILSKTLQENPTNAILIKVVKPKSKTK
jgi:hypothetical protein